MSHLGQVVHTINITYGLSKQALEALYSIVAQKSVIARMKKISQSRFFSWWSENKVTYVINSPSAWQTPTLFSKVRRNSEIFDLSCSLFINANKETFLQGIAVKLCMRDILLSNSIWHMELLRNYRMSQIEMCDCKWFWGMEGLLILLIFLWRHVLGQ